jgi:hypothetical protein
LISVNIKRLEWPWFILAIRWWSKSISVIIFNI